MKKLTFLVFGFLLIACQGKKEEPQAGAHLFYDFDQADHYHLDISRQTYDSILRNPDKSRLDLGLMQILRENIPTSGRDTLFIPNMDILKFRKNPVAEADLEALRKIFSERKAAAGHRIACEPIFNDVIVFRKKGKFIGAAKVSFECEKSYLVGARYGTAGFGQDGEFAELKTLLNR